MASLGSHRVCHTAEVFQTSQDKDQFAHRSKKRKTLSWRMGTWNVRSMVDTEGPIEVASRWGRGERMAALQETKWFGSEVYQVGGSVELTVEREEKGHLKVMTCKGVKGW